MKNSYPPLTKEEIAVLIQYYSNPGNRATLKDDVDAIREGCEIHKIEVPVWAEKTESSNG